jgi:TonB family protein
LALVLSLHAAIFCGLMMAGTKFLKPPEPPALEPHVIDQPLPQIKPPPLLLHRSFTEHLMAPPVLELRGPAVEINESKLSPSPESESPQPADPRPVAHEIVRVPGGTGAAFPHPDDFYPDASRRLAEEGAAVLKVCVDLAGRLTENPVMQATSGSGRLDAAAIRLAKAGSGQYRPTTEDGRAVPSCFPIKIRFQLK